MDHESEPLISDQTILLGIDDTDTIDSEYGTGKVSRLMGGHVDEKITELTWRGSVRQQLLIDDRVPYTTHNSSATLVCETSSSVDRQELVAVAADFLAEIAADGSDPGLCVGRTHQVTDAVQEFGIAAGEDLVTEQRAYEVAHDAGLFLDEYGGTGEGVIGALAGVGRTATGDYGRFVGYGSIRTYSGDVSVAEIRSDGIRVVTTRGTVLETGEVITEGWVRPILRGGRPVLEVEKQQDGKFRPTNIDD